MTTRKSNAKSFRATLEHLPSALKWVIIRVPFDAKKVWKGPAQPKVRGTINGFAFRTSLFSMRGGGHMLLVNKRMQAGAHVKPGMSANFRLEPDLEERTVVTPQELTRAMAGDRALRNWYAKLNYSHHKYIADWITDVKSGDARVRRAEQIAERLMETLEAEIELPPLVKQAFERDSRAHEGWNLMSVLQRRQQLMAIFYYRTPDSRARRLERVVQNAAAFAEKKRDARRRTK